MDVRHEPRPRYWEWRTELERARDRLWVMVLGLGAGCLVLVSLVVWLALRPLPVYYVSGSMGTAWPGQVPDTVVEDFASRVVTLLGNVHASSARRVYSLSGRYLTPALSSRLAIQAKSDLDAIESQRLGMAFAQTEVAVVEKLLDPPAWDLIVKGTRTAWAGQQLLGQESVEYAVRIVRTPATDLNPYGLAVELLQVRTLPRQARRD